ncbi:uncharacterized protein [Ptychodera flava]|uniref:uncharacterized protein n=1 Tax=Ptychodera flava TaxID=63121 RepID=UPI003969E722
MDHQDKELSHQHLYFTTAPYRSAWLYDHMQSNDTQRMATVFGAGSTLNILTPNGTRQGNAGSQEMEIGGGSVANSGSSASKCKKRAKRWADETSSHGIARVANARSKCGRFFWTVIIICASVGLLTIITLLVREFLGYPVNTVLTIVPQNSAIFPAVTVCNTNRVRASELKNSRFAALMIEADINPNHRYYEPCLEEDFKCTEGGCLKYHRVCDGIWDCDATNSKSSDEQDCIYESCHEDQFQCRSAGPNGICISKDKVCNGKFDCAFTEDELNCECTTDEITCVDPLADTLNEIHSKWCVRSHQICDGIQDCFQPNDEYPCMVPIGTMMVLDEKCLMVHNENQILHTIKNVTESWCEVSFNVTPCFRCLSSQYNRGTSECTILMESHLIGGNQLVDDENCTYYYKNLTTYCNGFSCDNKTKCLPKSTQCDFLMDCDDGTDEDGCSRPCFETEFACGNGQCLDPYKVCDKTEDCVNGSDEINCPENCSDIHFLCRDSLNGDRCIPKYKYCDYRQDCKNPNDEDPDECRHRQVLGGEDLFSEGWYDSFVNLTDNVTRFETFRNNVYHDLGFERVQYEDPPDWNGFFLFSSTVDFSDLKRVLKFDEEEVRILGHQREDMILLCKYNDQKCDVKDFLQESNDVYGNCFTFNHGIDLPTRNASRTGPAYGLELVLYTEQNEYTDIYGQESGIRVAVHRQGVMPQPQDRGVTAPPGMKTSIGIRKQVITRLPTPYGDCSDHEQDKEWKRMFGDRQYSQLVCQSSCIQRHLLLYCGCIDSYQGTNKTAPKCSILNGKQEMCRQLIYFLFQNGDIACKCSQSCFDVIFGTRLSLSRWPSDKADKTVTNIIKQRTSTTGLDKEQIRANLLKVVIYYEDLNSQSMTETPAYKFFSLFSDLGGSLGLFIGVSLVTVVEFFEYILDTIRILICALKKKCRGR